MMKSKREPILLVLIKYNNSKLNEFGKTDNNNSGPLCTYYLFTTLCRHKTGGLQVPSFRTAFIGLTEHTFWFWVHNTISMHSHQLFSHFWRKWILFDKEERNCLCNLFMYKFVDLANQTGPLKSGYSMINTNSPRDGIRVEYIPEYTVTNTSTNG